MGRAWVHVDDQTITFYIVAWSLLFRADCWRFEIVSQNARRFRVKVGVATFTTDYESVDKSEQAFIV